MFIMIVITVIISFLSDNLANALENNTSLLAEFFGPTLYRWDSEKNVVEEATIGLLKSKKVLGVYFSASWCGPCRQFTPLLANFYKDMKKNGRSFEVIWVSRDRSPQEFLDYYEKMPWLAVTWENFQRVGQRLSQQLNMKGIPHLAILEGDDLSVITLDGRTQVMRDKYGLEFPWRPRSLLSLVQKTVKKYVSTHAKLLMRSLMEVARGAFGSIAPISLLNLLRESIAESLGQLGTQLGRVSKQFLHVAFECVKTALFAVTAGQTDSGAETVNAPATVPADL